MNAPKKARLPALTMAQKIVVVDMIRADKANTPDADIAGLASDQLGRAVSAQLVASYRKELGLPSIKQPTREELRRKLAELQLKLNLQGGGEPGDVRNVTGNDLVVNAGGTVVNVPQGTTLAVDAGEPIVTVLKEPSFAATTSETGAVIKVQEPAPVVVAS